MAYYELSRTGRTTRPYYLSSVGLNLYSVEELLFFLHRHPALIDEDIRSEKLLGWLAEEFGLTHVTYAMRRGLMKDGDTTLLILPLMREMSYLTPGELNSYLKKLQTLDHASKEVRLKMQAEDLYAMRRYGAAEDLSREALETAPLSERGFRASMLTIEAASRMQLLMWEEAADLFREAYELHPTAERKLRLLLALRLTKPRERYEELAEEIGADDEQLKMVREKIEEAYAADLPDPDHPEELLEKYCTLYHEESGR